MTLNLPETTIFDRKIPKSKFYEKLEVPTDLKKLFVEQIEHILWKNKIAPSTVNIAPGKEVEEVEVIEIYLKGKDLDEKILQLIDKEIPYHLLFILKYERDVQAWIGFKEKSQAGSAAFRFSAYFHTEWMPLETLQLRLDGLNMDDAYGSFIIQIAGDKLVHDKTSSKINIKDAVERDKKRQKLQREIVALEKKILNEKQFNRQVASNEELKRLIAE